MQFLDVVYSNVNKNPDRVAVTSDFNENPMTYNELWSTSGSIYNYLKTNGIGREDFILIKLPRGAETIATALGVLRAGAAFTIVEDIYPDDRINYIAGDCDCKLIVDIDKYNDIIKTEPIDGYEESDVHDACFAIYTSGTTGNPKGVLHEYGKLDYCIKSIPIGILKEEGALESFAAIMPMNFVAFIFVFVACLFFNITIYMIGFALAKNFIKFTELLDSEKINYTFMSPSMIRVYKNPAKTLKIIITGSEPAGGIYYGTPMIYNIYAMSEAGMCISGFMLDKSYEKAPVGKNITGVDIKVIREDGSEAEFGETGEICFENKYFRGYINLPNENASVMREGIFHTGDLGVMDEDGNLTISGRSDDMIKINGNRIEPAEIEAVAKDILKASNIVAKGFDEDGSAFVVLYGVKAEISDSFEDNKIDDLRDAMASKLPEYMIPTYFVALDELPINPNGKVAKKLLKSPRQAEIIRDIVKPESDTEALICKLMANVLKLEEVGVTEDFYYLGGDSLKTIQLVSELEEEGLSVSAQDIYNGRSARDVAVIISDKSLSKEEVIQADKDARENAYPIFHPQWQLIKSSEMSGQVNVLANRLKIMDGADENRLKDAADKVIKAHPELCMRFTMEGDIYEQSYDESYFSLTEIVNTTEDDLDSVSKDIVKNIGFINTPQYNSSVITTGKSVYYQLSLSHLIADGESQRLLLSQIAKAYIDPSYESELDVYYYILNNRIKTQQGKLREAEEFFESRREGIDGWSMKKDHESDNMTGQTIYIKDAMDIIPSLDNTFYITAYALAIANYNNSDKSLIYSIYHGRDSRLKRDAAGHMLQEVFIRLDKTKTNTPQTMIASVKEQMIKNLSLDVSMYLVDNRINTYEMPRLIYQANRDDDALLNNAATESEMIRVSNSADGIMSLNLVERVKDGKLDVLVRYADKIYDKESIISFLGFYKEAVKWLLGGMN